MLTTGLVIVAGEITTNAKIDYAQIARETIREIGYDRAKYGFDCDTCAVITAIAGARLGLGCRVVSALSAPAAGRLRRERVGVLNVKRENEPHAVTAALSTAANRTFVTFDGVNDAIEPRLLAAVPRIRGRHIHFDRKTVTTGNLLLSILDLYDIHQDKQGDSTGRLAKL